MCKDGDCRPYVKEDGVATFFESADEFAAWLEKHGAEAPQLIVGFHKRGTQRKSMTWPESVDAALCFGWIDGVRKRIDSTGPKDALTNWSYDQNHIECGHSGGI